MLVVGLFLIRGSSTLTGYRQVRCERKVVLESWRGEKMVLGYCSGFFYNLLVAMTGSTRERADTGFNPWCFLLGPGKNGFVN